jgi:putative two-component system response regulator
VLTPPLTDADAVWGQGHGPRPGDLILGQDGGEALTQARILVVDDEPSNVRLMERMLQRAGYTQVRSTTRSGDVLALCAEWRPDLILLDVRMPDPDGLELLLALEPWIAAGSRIPVIMLTADTKPATRLLALGRGARDFLSKPLDMPEALLRIRATLETRRLQLCVERQNTLLSQRIQERSDDLEGARLELVQRLALAAEYRDDDTQEHAERVGRTSALLARALGQPPQEIGQIRRAAPLHDVGKIGVPDAIFLKRGRLTAEEFTVMQRHTEIGANILSGSTSPVLRLAAQIAATHHERWDGTGYPAGLNGEHIPLAGRIVAVADVFDALTHERPYKDAWPLDKAAAEIRCGSGSHFDPRVVDAFGSLDHPRLLSPVGSAVLAGDGLTGDRALVGTADHG